mgnify:CR=1 FL=1
MKLHEYQAKALLKRYGINVPNGYVAENPNEAYDIARKMGIGKYVVKAQVLAGGRGKGGGVRIVDSPEEVMNCAKDMLGMTLKTVQTGLEGKKVKKLLIEEAVDIEKEYYLSFIMDNSEACVTMLASSEGGTEIEEVAAKYPEKISKIKINALIGICDFQARSVAKSIGIPDKTVRTFIGLVKSMYKLFIDNDCSLLEINPLVLTGTQEIYALDAKITFDDNALFRHKDIESMKDIEDIDFKEIEASRYGMNYVSLSGDIGCIANGAGLAMATMDAIHSKGGSPANFLDVGGGADNERVINAFRIILLDKSVKAIFVNIFGGITSCKTVAEGLISAAEKLSINVPVVVRLEGMENDEARELLNNSGYNIIEADSLSDGAGKVVKIINNN